MSSTNNQYELTDHQDSLTYAPPYHDPRSQRLMPTQEEVSFSWADHADTGSSSEHVNPLAFQTGMPSNVAIDPVPITDNAGPLYTSHPRPWTYEYRSNNPSTEALQGDLPSGAGYLNYVRHIIGASGSCCSTTWTNASAAGGTVVWRHEVTSEAVPGLSVVIAGDCWYARRDSVGAERGTTLREAGQRMAQRFRNLDRAAPGPSTRPSLLSEPFFALKTMPGRLALAHWETSVVRGPMSADLAVEGAVPLSGRTSYEGDIYSGTNYVCTRRWAVEFIISNLNTTRNSAFSPDALELILDQALNPMLDAHQIPLHQIMPDGVYTQSFYIATDGGEVLVQDEHNPPLPTMYAGTLESALPVLTLRFAVLPDPRDLVETSTRRV